MNNPIQIWNPEREFKLTAVAPNLWIVRHPLTFCGFKMVTCMSVLRLASGGLWLHSPVPLSAELKASLDALGSVEYIVAPNRMHHLYALDCTKAYPHAQLYVAKDLSSKNPAFVNFPVIPTGTDAPWFDSIDSVFVEGNTELNETVFFDRASRTLIITDLAVFMGPWDSFGSRVYARINGCYNRFGHSFLLKKFFRDKTAVRRSLHQILEWDFKRIVLAHGPIIENDARLKVETAFAWLL
jgi:hypothetical protein